MESAGLALVLASVGLYSVIAFLVAQRHQEFGVRMALGASRSRIVSYVLFAGAQPVAMGMLVGFALCLIMNSMFNRWTQGSLYDPIVILPVLGVLVFSSTVASFLPACRACSIAPMEALRNS